jgi:hypothetical protein
MNSRHCRPYQIVAAAWTWATASKGFKLTLVVFFHS